MIDVNVAVHLDKACHGRRGRHLRQCWDRNWILERTFFGQYEVLMDKLLNSILYGYRNFVRQSPKLFSSDNWWKERDQ